MESSALRLSRATFPVARLDFRAPGSARARVQAAQLAEAAHVVSQVLQPDLRFRPHHADRAHQCAAHVIGLCAEDMLDPRAHRGFGPVAAPGLFGQRLAALALAVDVALQLHAAQLGFHLLGPISGISPDPRAGIAPRQQVVHRLAVVQGGIADMVTPHQLVLAVHVHMVLVATVRFPVLLGPAGIRIFL